MSINRKLIALQTKKKTQKKEENNVGFIAIYHYDCIERQYNCKVWI